MGSDWESRRHYVEYMRTRWPDRRRDLKVFFLLVFVGYALLGVTIPLFVIGYPRSTLPMGWLWIVATPSMILTELGADRLGKWLLPINPFIYAVIWWSLWRMWRLFRERPKAE